MRLGDYIDDHCSRCKRTTDHSVVAMMGDEVLKTRCRTCNNEHKYRRNKTRNTEMTAKEAFDKLMATAMAAQGQEAAPPKKERKGKAKR